MPFAGRAAQVSGPAAAPGSRRVRSAGCGSPPRRPPRRPLRPAPHGGHYSYRCIEPHDGAYDGAGVQQWACNGGFTQQWRTVPIGDGIVVLRHLMSGKCLQDMGRPDGERREVGLMPCTGADNQAWRAEGRDR
ncbi:RICIN domain-containing protein [Streptomyces sp. Edi2]|uniref:RICIN domain-containing protein n=1 Tax=Streptomyces sp. Edi2 TaxID=3162528 RepID=UPI00330676D3